MKAYLSRNIIMSARWCSHTVRSIETEASFIHSIIWLRRILAKWFWKEKQSKDFNLNWLSTITYPWQTVWPFIWNINLFTRGYFIPNLLEITSVVRDLENNINRWNSLCNYHIPSDKNKRIYQECLVPKFAWYWFGG